MCEFEHKRRSYGLCFARYHLHWFFFCNGQVSIPLVYYRWHYYYVSSTISVYVFGHYLCYVFCKSFEFSQILWWIKILQSDCVMYIIVCNLETTWWCGGPQTDNKLHPYAWPDCVTTIEKKDEEESLYNIKKHLLRYVHANFFDCFVLGN